ncbi:MotE family protein [Pelagibacterium limicola]|uniref:MotE family protein n=1 Tax=Pelagibacterium limicola TaxID=2791022 RepID=UPI0018AF75F3|nr:hypothetical protein [Pelagibacterium limicola]
MKTMRLLPIVILAASALLVLKVSGLVFGEGYILTGISGVTASEHGTPASDEANLAAADVAARALFENTPAPAEGDAVPTLQFDSQGAGRPVALVEDDTERLILERLAARRAELDALAEELDMRLAVVEAAELRLEERMAELMALEARINAAMDEQEARNAGQFAGLVAMYESMRPSDAATIFNDLETSVLLQVSRSMNPRKLGPIMAKMHPAKAQGLTVLMAAEGESAQPEAAQGGFAHLPQIVGQ